MFPFFLSLIIEKIIGNMFSVFLASGKTTLLKVCPGELKKAVELHSPMACVFTAFLILPNFHCFYNLIETVHDFYFLIKYYI